MIRYSRLFTITSERDADIAKPLLAFSLIKLVSFFVTNRLGARGPVAPLLGLVSFLSQSGCCPLLGRNQSWRRANRRGVSAFFNRDSTFEWTLLGPF